MAQFRPMVITKQGQNLISEMLSGNGNIEFTKISLSDTEYSDEEIFEITELDGVKQSTGISKITKTSNAAVKIEGATNNAELTAGYYIKTIALYAKNSSGGEEVIYAACGASIPGWMPPYNGISSSGVYLKLITTVQNASNVELEIDPAAVATIGDIINLRDQTDTLSADIADLKSVISCEQGTITLTNTLEYPFNDSIQTVSLEKERPNMLYSIFAEVTETDGNVGQIQITDCLENGFKVAFTGSAKTVKVKYKVMGGYENESN